MYIILCYFILYYIIKTLYYTIVFFKYCILCLYLCVYMYWLGPKMEEKKAKVNGNRYDSNEAHGNRSQVLPGAPRYFRFRSGHGKPPLADVRLHEDW